MSIQELEEHLNRFGQYFSPDRFNKVIRIIMAEFKETND